MVRIRVDGGGQCKEFEMGWGCVCGGEDAWERVQC